MKTIQNKTLGFVIPILVPSTVSEAVTIFGSEDNVVDVINMQEVYHGWNTTFGDKFTTELEAKYKVARAVVKVTPATETRKEVKQYEPNQRYVRRVLEEGKDTDGSALTLAKLDPLAQSIAAGIKYAEGGGSVGGRIGKTYLETAEGILALDETSREGVVSRLLELNPGITITRDSDEVPTVESLARALKQDQINQEEARKSRLGIANLPKKEAADAEAAA